MRHRNNKDISEKSTPQVSNSKPTETKSTLHKKILFKDVVALPPHSSFHILSHQIAPDSTLNGSNSTGRQSTSDHTLKRLLVTLYIAKNNNNAIAVDEAVNALIK